MKNISMAEAAKSIVDYAGSENFVYINVMNRMSVDCDCNGDPAEPTMKGLHIDGIVLGHGTAIRIVIPVGVVMIYVIIITRRIVIQKLIRSQCIGTAHSSQHLHGIRTIL